MSVTVFLSSGKPRVSNGAGSGFSFAAEMRRYQPTVCAMFTAILLAMYSLTTTRIDSNIYKFESGYVRGFIETRWCYEYAYSDSSVLVDASGYLKLVFSSGTTCEVVSIRKI